MLRSLKIILFFPLLEPKTTTNSTNIRYVNIRFINKKDTGIIVFPDRGKKKSTGYSVSGKTSTFLEFVLKEGKECASFVCDINPFLLRNIST